MYCISLISTICTIFILIINGTDKSCKNFSGDEIPLDIYIFIIGQIIEFFNIISLVAGTIAIWHCTSE